MSDPLTIAVIASTAVSAYGAIQQGKYAEAAAENEARQYKEEKMMAQIQAIEESNDRTRDFLDMKASNLAYFAAKTNTDPYESSTFLALKKANADTLDRDLGSMRLLSSATQRKYDMSIFNSQMSAKAARIGSYARASQSLLSGASTYKQVTT